MKKVITLFALLFGTHTLLAQAMPQGGAGGCVIKYDYNAVGNRIKRSKYSRCCWYRSVEIVSRRTNNGGVH